MRKPIAIIFFKKKSIATYFSIFIVWINQMHCACARKIEQMKNII